MESISRQKKNLMFRNIFIMIMIANINAQGNKKYPYYEYIRYGYDIL